jgi:hypothetical protein
VTGVQTCALPIWPIPAIEGKEEQEELKKKLEQFFRKRLRKKWIES